MADQNYGALYASAIAESGMGSEVLPDDTYPVKIATVKPGNSANGKFRVGIRLVILGGPHDGKSTWVNQTFTADNPKAVAVFLRILKEFGVPDAAIAQGQPPEQLVTYIATGTLGNATLSSHTHGLNDDQTPKRFQDVKKFVITGMEGAAVQGIAPAPQAPAAPVAQPAVQQEQPAAPPASVPTPAVAGAVPTPF